MSKLAEALDARRAAQKAVEDLLRRDYAPPQYVKWARTGRVHDGEVVRNLSGERLEVENYTTGKRSIIRAFNIVDAEGFAQ